MDSDVSWLHHNAVANQRKTTSKASSKQSSKASSRAPSPPPDLPKSPPPQQKQAHTSPLQKETNMAQATAPIPIAQPSVVSGQAKTPPKRAGLLHRGSSDKFPSVSTSSSPEETRSSKTAWIRSLSSKFSSQDKIATASPQPSIPPPQQTPPQAPQPKSPLFSPPAERSTFAVDPDSSGQQQARSSSSFFSSALRRLSSSTATNTPSKPVPQGSACPRQLLNIDTERDRCQVPELKGVKLRRVAFSVDVEVAGVSRYIEESDSTEPAAKAKDKKVQARSEGEALKNPKFFAEKKESKETASSIVNGPVDQRQSSIGSVDDMLENEMLAAAKRQELQEAAAKKRQAKEEKRRKRVQDTDTAGQSEELKPPQIELDVRPGSSHPEDRPTTDPLRIYRRCCQLREAPVLKRISEQLANVKQDVEKTGYVPILNLNGSRLQLPDLGCLGDWLAVVPVKRLLMDNANLTDEGLQVVLAGLLATKPPEAFRHKPSRSSPTRRREQNKRKPHGVIEKLSLRLNHKITVDGWKHICVFLNLASSLRAIDLSLIPFPHLGGSGANPEMSAQDPTPLDMANILYESILTRSARFSCIEELIVSECKLTAHDVGKIVDAACSGSIRKLGLAKNNLDTEAIAHIQRFLRSENCGGLDLGGNDLRASVPLLAKSINRDSKLWALCLADCNLDPPSLALLFPALVRLPEIRVFVLSHNRALFSSTPDSVGIVRKYLPACSRLRRLDLTDVSMSPQQAIAIADILPDVRNMNHLGLGENNEIRRLSTATDPASQEEACALYGSLMVAARISKTLLAVDIEVPSKDSSEIVQALAKQVVAYSFRNVERFTAVDAINHPDPASLISDQVDKGNDVPVPEVLAHLIGTTEDETEQPTELDIRRDHDYIVGGTGVVKALSYVLGQRSTDYRRGSGTFSGTSSPSHPGTPGSEDHTAREMSKNLLNSARKIRARLQLTMAREGETSDELALRRLQFLDHTLQGMIERFENAYPDCALPTNMVSMQYPFRAHPTPVNPAQSSAASAEGDAAEAVDLEQDAASHRSRTSSTASSEPSATSGGSALSAAGRAETLPEHGAPTLLDSRRGSTASLAARAQAHEEGRMHRFGQRFRREILPPSGSDDHYHRTSRADPAEAPHLAVLRSKMETLGGQEIREKVIQNGLENTVREYSEEAERLRRDSMPVFDDIDLPEIVGKGGRDKTLATLEGKTGA